MRERREKIRDLITHGAPYDFMARIRNLFPAPAEDEVSMEVADIVFTTHAPLMFIAH